MYQFLRERLLHQLSELKQADEVKSERVLSSAQLPEVKLANGKKVLNFSSNNYLGLATNPKVIDAAYQTMIQRGYGLASSRFICGTQDIHKELEQTITKFLGTEDTLLYNSAFDANGGLFSSLFGKEDAIFSDALNHASIIDGTKLSKAKLFVYEHNNMADLEKQLAEATEYQVKVIVTDGVFSLDGTVAQLKKIVSLAKKYKAITMIDESHATGFMGVTGRGTHEYCGVMGQIDIITGTLGKALGGALGGFTSGRKEIIDMLRQVSHPYIYSNSLAPPIVGASLEVFSQIEKTTSYRDKVFANTEYFRTKMTELGFDIKAGLHPIVPVMIYDAELTHKMAKELLEEGIYVIGFSYPIVPKNEARIRVQMSANHTKKHLDQAIKAFVSVGKKLNIINLKS